MTFAGIWDTFQGESWMLRIFSLVTTAVNNTVRSILDQKPVIVGSGQWSAWRGDEDGDAHRDTIESAPDVSRNDIDKHFSGGLTALYLAAQSNPGKPANVAVARN